MEKVFQALQAATGRGRETMLSSQEMRRMLDLSALERAKGHTDLLVPLSPSGRS